MANLDEMRTFQTHWHAYLSYTHDLGLLCHRVPLDLAGLTDEERAQPLTREPASAARDTRALQSAVSAALAGRTAVEPAAPDPAELAWGWWFSYPAWERYRGIGERTDALNAARVTRAQIADEEKRALEADAAYTEAVATLAEYEAANEDDARTLAEAEARLKDPLAGEGPLPRGIIARWIARWHRARKAKRERELATITQKEVRERLELRGQEVKLLEEVRDARREAVAQLFADRRASATDAVSDAEGALVALLAQLLGAHGYADEADALAQCAFDDACARANTLMWDVLDAWMREYVRALPQVIEHAALAWESERVWLEGHDPYGRRYWPLTDEVVAFMESGRTEQSSIALERCLAERAARVVEGADEQGDRLPLDI